MRYKYKKIPEKIKVQWKYTVMPEYELRTDILKF